jgi:hypothetical protein
MCWSPTMRHSKNTLVCLVRHSLDLHVEGGSQSLAGCSRLLDSVLRYRLEINIPTDTSGNSAHKISFASMPAHRAMADTVVTAYILARLLEHMSIAEMLAVENEPAICPKINFGKYRGEKWADVPRDYLEWIVTR